MPTYCVSQYGVATNSLLGDSAPQRATVHAKAQAVGAKQALSKLSLRIASPLSKLAVGSQIVGVALGAGVG